MKKIIAVLFVAFAALFVVPYQIVVGVAAVAVAIGLWKGAFDSNADTSTYSGSAMNIGEPAKPLNSGEREYADLGPGFMPASMKKFRSDDDLTIH